MSTSKDFDLIVTKGKGGEALEEPTTITYTANFTDTEFTISDSEGVVFQTDRGYQPDWETVDDGISWFLSYTEGNR